MMKEKSQGTEHISESIVCAADGSHKSAAEGERRGRGSAAGGRCVHDDEVGVGRAADVLGRELLAADAGNGEGAGDGLGHALRVRKQLKHKLRRDVFSVCGSAMRKGAAQRLAELCAARSRREVWRWRGRSVSDVLNEVRGAAYRKKS